MATRNAEVRVVVDGSEFVRDLQKLRRQCERRAAVPSWCRSRTMRMLVLTSALVFPLSHLLEVLR